MHKSFLLAFLGMLPGAIFGQETAEKPAAPKEPVPDEVVAGNLFPTTAANAARKVTSGDATETAQIKAGNALRALPVNYRTVIVEALKRFQARDFTGAMLYTERADKMQFPTVWTLNIRGAIAIEKRQFEEGTRYCNEVLKMDPSFFPAKFNLCEIPFLQGKPAEARQMWEKLLDNYPVNPAQAKEDGTPELLTYRIFLCYVLEKDQKNAKEWLEKIPFPSVTPAYHYGNAVWEREQGRMDKWEDWLAQAEFVWPEIKRANFTDVLIQLGWVKPPYGEPPPASQPEPVKKVEEGRAVQP